MSYVFAAYIATIGSLMVYAGRLSIRARKAAATVLRLEGLEAAQQESPVPPRVTSPNDQSDIK
jgi:hypothetical protein